MNRLTKRLPNGKIGYAPLKQGECVDVIDLLDCFGEKLAAYEDTGLEPEEILTAKESAEIACALNELKKYKDAEEEGRLVVLPCKVGDKVYFQNDYHGKSIVEAEIKCLRFRATENKVLFGADVEFNIVDPYYVDGRLMRCGAIVGIENNFGNQPTAFLTREEAEAALEKMKGEQNE